MTSPYTSSWSCPWASFPTRLLRQRGGRCRDYGTRWSIGQQLERERAAEHGLAIWSFVPAATGPAAPPAHGTGHALGSVTPQRRDDGRRLLAVRQREVGVLPHPQAQRRVCAVFVHRPG